MTDTERLRRRTRYVLLDPPFKPAYLAYQPTSSVHLSHASPLPEPDQWPSTPVRLPSPVPRVPPFCWPRPSNPRPQTRKQEPGARSCQAGLGTSKTDSKEPDREPGQITNERTPTLFQPRLTSDLNPVHTPQLDRLRNNNSSNNNNNNYHYHSNRLDPFGSNPIGSTTIHPALLDAPVHGLCIGRPILSTKQTIKNTCSASVQCSAVRGPPSCSPRHTLTLQKSQSERDLFFPCRSLPQPSPVSPSSRACVRLDWLLGVLIRPDKHELAAVGN